MYASQQWTKDLLGDTLKEAKDQGLLGGGGNGSNEYLEYVNIAASFSNSFTANSNTVYFVGLVDCTNPYNPPTITTTGTIIHDNTIPSSDNTRCTKYAFIKCSVGDTISFENRNGDFVCSGVVCNLGDVSNVTTVCEQMVSDASTSYELNTNASKKYLIATLSCGQYYSNSQTFNMVTPFKFPRTFRYGDGVTVSILDNSAGKVTLNSYGTAWGNGSILVFEIK